MGKPSRSAALPCIVSTTEITTDNLTITGGATLNGGNAGSVLTIDSGVTVTIRSLTITGGSGNGGFSGGIPNFGSVTLDGGSTITGNTAGSDGGGIYNSFGTVTLAGGSHITGNKPDNCVPGCSG